MRICKVSKLTFALVLVFSFSSCRENRAPETMIKLWEKHTLSFTGPSLSEDAEDNPFLNYRLNVIFQNEDREMLVPGFYAADGNAAQTGSSSGNQWKVHFRPDAAGLWTYQVSFRKGENIALSDDPSEGEPESFDGASGEIMVMENPGHNGRLIVTGGRYLQYAASGDYFIKGGADSPENFLAYEDFDGTYRVVAQESRQGEAAVQELHSYPSHVADWKEGDPTWQVGKGKGMIGALNYLAGKGMNSVYFLTMNINADGKDVWPYTGHEERFRFDCSKLDQWEIVFDHMDELGLMLHIVLQETENETLLDNGNTGPERQIYYREMIARFAHHLMITWNMGEENGPAGFSPNGQNTEQQKAMLKYIKEHDPYQNYTVIHSHSMPRVRDSLFRKLLGYEHLDGMSLQAGDPANVHDITLQWIEESRKAGHPWIMTTDEIGHSSKGVLPDNVENNNQDTVRAQVLWGTLMAGGGGVEWYFGWRYDHNDLGCEDWRSRENVWEFTRHALDFFHHYLPFPEMVPSDHLVEGKEMYCFAKPGKIYAVYASQSNSISLDLSNAEGDFSVEWFDPRSGGDLQQGNIRSVTAGKRVDLGTPPDAADQDWAILLTKQ